ncbi:conserved hypothetical protein, partial [Trichinella spiralis]|uniref:hypothetical protein n=1 Tax=Trichinella spiralis TaxID=6334 RepID=UPI0001EFE0E1
RTFFPYKNHLNLSERIMQLLQTYPYRVLVFNVREIAEKIMETPFQYLSTQITK